jgi:glyoxylase-like metal-dependent hydrolase (beta-lactamase superfamily II)/rhodanese-related sulfurtransferase
MKIEQIYTGCLAHGAYFIESSGQAIVIDPLREVQPYLDRAKRDQVKIKYILETHFHADFVSGHLDLAKESGATIVYGPNAKPAFKAHVASDGEILKVGGITIQVIHTPGHTMESACYLLKDETGKAAALFTGDTLFIGDVGRPDLAQKGAINKDVLAGYLFDSLRNKIMVLPHDITIYPAHGAGSACGKNMSKETQDTLGHQIATNYALRENMTREEFIQEVTEGLFPPPVYFPENVRMNREGYESITEVMQRANHELAPDAFEVAANETGALLLDTRDPQVFAEGFIPNSINIGIDGSFAPWVGAMIKDIRQPILIIAEPGREKEVVMRLARVGYDFAIGYLKGGFASWKAVGKEVDKIESISAETFAIRISKEKDAIVLDVRKPNEFASGHLVNAIPAPLDYIEESMQSVSKNSTNYVHCQGGYRSMIFASILKSRGYTNVVDIKGGFKAIQDSGKFKIEIGEPVHYG